MIFPDELTTMPSSGLFKGQMVFAVRLNPRADSVVQMAAWWIATQSPVVNGRSGQISILAAWRVPSATNGLPSKPDEHLITPAAHLGSVIERTNHCITAGTRTLVWSPVPATCAVGPVFLRLLLGPATSQLRRR